VPSSGPHSAIGSHFERGGRLKQRPTTSAAGRGGRSPRTTERRALGPSALCRHRGRRRSRARRGDVTSLSIRYVDLEEPPPAPSMMIEQTTANNADGTNDGDGTVTLDERPRHFA
jgi:hypothetical protein